MITRNIYSTALFKLALVISWFVINSFICAQQSPTRTNVSSPDDQYVPGKDSLAQPGVPTGKTFDFIFDHSATFPGTSRKITVYVPAQYRADRPACVYVGLDGLAFNAPVVFDNLIFKHEMPVTIAIGVSPGAVDAANPSLVPKTAAPSDIDGDWQGILDTGEDKLLVMLHVTNSEIGLKATIDVPNQDVNGLSISPFTRRVTSLTFEVSNFGIIYHGTLTDDLRILNGTWMQPDKSVLLAFKRMTMSRN